jgi:hypothetical protein
MRVKSSRMTADRTVIEYWDLEQGYPLVRTEAMKLAAFAGSGADVERVFSTGRATFDYYMGSLDSETISLRLCAKVNGLMLKLFGCEKLDAFALTRVVLPDPGPDDDFPEDVTPDVPDEAEPNGDDDSGAV